MAVCINFNYRRVNMSGNGAGASTGCGTAGTQTKVGLIGGGAFVPSPFTAVLVQRFTNGLDLGVGVDRPVAYRSDVSGYTPSQIPHVAQGLGAPGAAGQEGVGFYIMFGQKRP